MVISIDENEGGKFDAILMYVFVSLYLLHSLSLSFFYSMMLHPIMMFSHALFFSFSVCMCCFFFVKLHLDCFNKEGLLTGFIYLIDIYPVY